MGPMNCGRKTHCVCVIYVAVTPQSTKNFLFDLILKLKLRFSNNFIQCDFISFSGSILITHY